MDRSIATKLGLNKEEEREDSNISRSNPTPINPAKKFFKWKGSTGNLVYWDKEREKEIEVKLPFEFLVLDELSTITGFCEPDKSSYWSNEVRSLAREELTVKTSMGTKQTGLYKDLADVRGKGAKYAKSIYISHKEPEEWVIGNLKASGAAVTAWIEFGKTCVPGNGKVVLTGSEEAKKGTTTYFIPQFKYESASIEENDIAIELDKELQVHLSQYLAGNERNDFNQETPVYGEGDEGFPDLPVSFK